MNSAQFDGEFDGLRVVVTGHTGFKGAWLTRWLLGLGAEVTGLALEPDTQPALFDEMGLAANVDHHIGDIRDAERTARVLAGARPDLILHLAAQPLVRRSYAEPAYTYATNVMGTLNVLEAARTLDSLRGIVVITTDKVYRNAETGVAFAEDDPLGGEDPYSSSKACCEILTHSYAASFLTGQGIAVATARAGNVIGGGDWAADRIVPDCVRALAAEESVLVRNPGSVRPWQHVLEPLSGYLWLASRMLSSGPQRAGSFNFGPSPDDARTVAELAERAVAVWGSGSWSPAGLVDQPHEAELLRLDIARAREQLGWRPVWAFEDAVDRTIEWYRSRLLDGADATRLVADDIAAYSDAARASGLRWATGANR